VSALVWAKQTSQPRNISAKQNAKHSSVHDRDHTP
jgi:hypothetical protein